MAYTTAEAVEAIYNEFAEVSVPLGSPEDFVDWAVRHGISLDKNIIRLFEESVEGVYNSLEDYADDVFPGVEWQALVEAGYWQGDHSDMVFCPITKEIG